MKIILSLIKIYPVQLTNVQAKLSDGRKIIEANILNNNPYGFGKATM